MFGSGNTISIISNKEMNDIMKVIKSLEESGLLIKGISETIKNEAKDQKGGILGMLLGTSAATILAITFCDFLMFYKIFLSPQVKLIMIISNKYGIYELPHELTNDLRLRILANIKKILNLHRIIA